MDTIKLNKITWKMHVCWVEDLLVQYREPIKCTSNKTEIYQKCNFFNKSIKIQNSYIFYMKHFYFVLKM